MEPFLDDTPGLERSLTWHALNRNKRSITLDMHSADSREILAGLLAKFDIVFDAAMNGVAPLDDIAIPEKTVRIRIAPFASDGPKGRYAASDVTVMAASGAPAVTGDPDRAPLFFRFRNRSWKRAPMPRLRRWQDSPRATATASGRAGACRRASPR